MTTTEFLFFHSANTAANINTESRINVNTVINENGTGTITGVTVTVATRADWNAPASQANQLDLENVLLVATSIRFTVDNQTYTLPIVSKSKYISRYNDRSNYYYFEVTPTVFNITANVYAQTPPVVDVTFLPFVQDEKYEYSNSNPLISNALENRVSTYIQQADRQNLGAKPANLVQILNRAATPAQTQDSNYSSTGWSNARYAGSVTDAQDFKGIPPAIVGKLFTGELNPSSSADLLICSRSMSDRVLSELLFTGDTELPTFEGFVNTRYEVDVDIFGNTNIVTYQFNNTPATGTLEIGSIIKAEGKTEYMRVEKLEPELSRIQVTRGYLSTAIVDLDQQDKLEVLKPLRIFKIDSTTANVISATNSKVWIKESKEILLTDSYGIVYRSSSTCLT